MKKTIYILILSVSTICFSQVGIGTTFPEKELHVAGSSSTIRIESLNVTNNPTYNDGIKLAPAYIDGNGDITLGNGTGASGLEPLNFLIVVPNFVPTNPHGLTGSGWITATGVVINNNDLGESETIGQIVTVGVVVPQNAILEIKYGITMLVIGSNLLTGTPYFYINLDQTVAMQTYIKVDLNSDGLTGDELTKIYGRTAQYYVTNNQGIIGYPYMNGQAYLNLPAGTHTLYFFGQVNDDSTSYTSVGFGGAQDYLKIRIYN